MIKIISEKEVLGKKQNYLDLFKSTPVITEQVSKSLDELAHIVQEYSQKSTMHKASSEIDFLLGYFGLHYADVYGFCPKKSFEHLRAASDANHVDASILLSQVYLGNWDHVLRKKYIKTVGEHQFLPKEADFNKYSKGRIMLRKLALEKHEYALYSYAEFLGEEIECLNDDDANENDGLNDLKSMREISYVDEEGALKYLDECIKTNFLGGYFLKGLWLYDDKSPGAIDQEEAVRIWETAYNEVPIDSLFSIPFYYSICFALGCAYMCGDGCSKDEEKGLKFINEAIEGGNEHALEYLDDEIDDEVEDKPNEAKPSHSPLSYFAYGEGNIFQSEDTGLNISQQENGFYLIADPNDEHKPPIHVRIHHPEPKKQELSNFFNFDEDKQEELISNLLEPIDRLPGLCSIKSEVKDMVQYALIRMKREELGLKTKMTGAHMLFVGNPGTGKTIIARLLGNIFYQLGKLEKGHVVEADSSVLTGEYIGWTTSKTSLACHTALDGVLFIDEAYALTENAGTGGYDAGIESIDTLMKFMEDFSDRLIVIAAGYKDKMEYFINSNPGLRSRFSQTIEFKDYRPEDMLEIFHIFAKDYDYILTKKAEKKLFLHLKSIKGNDKDRFANARGVRNLFDATIKKQSKRLIKEKFLDKEKMIEIIAVDIPSDKTVSEGSVSYLATNISDL